MQIVFQLLFSGLVVVVKAYLYGSSSFFPPRGATSGGFEEAAIVGGFLLAVPAKVSRPVRFCL